MLHEVVASTFSVVSAESAKEGFLSWLTTHYKMWKFVDSASNDDYLCKPA